MEIKRLKPGSDSFNQAALELELSIDNYMRKQDEYRAAQFAFQGAKFDLTEVVLKAGLTECLTVNVGRVRRYLHHAKTR